MQCVVPENTHTHPEEGHWKFQGGGGGVSEANIFKGKCEVNLEFPEGWGKGVQTKKPCVGGLWILSGTMQFQMIECFCTGEKEKCGKVIECSQL